MASAHKAGAAFMEDRAEVPARNAHGGDDSHNDAGEERGGESVSENAPVEAEIETNGQIHLEIHRAQRRAAQDAEEDSGDSTSEREENAFREQLPDEAAASRAKRRADGHLAFTHGGADQKDVRDIAAGEQQNQRRETQEKAGDHHNGIRRVGIRSRMNLRKHKDADVLVGGVFGGEPLGNNGERRLRLCDADAGLQTAVYDKIPEPA